MLGGEKMRRIISVLLVLAICLSLCACGSGKNKLVGNWVCQETYDGYPDQLILKADGTGTGDGMSLTWYVEDGVIYMTVIAIMKKQYKYEFRGSVLYLDGHAYERK